jgi:hypothetical protein
MTAIGVAVIATVIFWLGYRLAVARRAWTDYKTTKAAVPKLRKGFFASVRDVAKFVFWSLLALVVLVSWVVHDIREAAAR